MSGDHTRADGSRWGERTIRDGSVRWHGRRYCIVPEKPAPLSPDFAPKEYDGSLDGLRAIFYEYGHTEHFPTLRDRIFVHSFIGYYERGEREPHLDDRGYFHFEEFAAPGSDTESGER